MMKRVLVYPNAMKDVDYKYTGQVVRLLNSKGVEVFLPEEKMTDLLHWKETTDKETDWTEGLKIVEKERLRELDLAIVLGGDGTMILCVYYLLGSEVPLLGVNLGRLGYMTEVELSDLEPKISLALEGQFTVEHRLMLEARFNDGTGEGEGPFYAVNDFLIHRDLADGILKSKAYINDEYMAEFLSDGVIIASPCGSTAYNFSAGGPILSPMADNIILTPLSSHAMLDRSVVVRGGDVLSFYLSSFSKSDHAVFQADGTRNRRIPENTWIHIRRSRYSFPLARVGNTGFYEIVQKKLLP